MQVKGTLLKLKGTQRGMCAYASESTDRRKIPHKLNKMRANVSKIMCTATVCVPVCVLQYMCCILVQGLKEGLPTHNLPPCGLSVIWKWHTTAAIYWDPPCLRCKYNVPLLVYSHISPLWLCKWVNPHRGGLEDWSLHRSFPWRTFWPLKQDKHRCSSSH